jgi:hypothetical protein
MSSDVIGDDLPVRQSRDREAPVRENGVVGMGFLCSFTKISQDPFGWLSKYDIHGVFQFFFSNRHSNPSQCKAQTTIQNPAGIVTD